VVTDAAHIEHICNQSSISLC